MSDYHGPVPFKVPIDPHAAGHLVGPLLGIDPHQIMRYPWLLMCGLPVGTDADGTTVVDVIVLPSQVDHIEALAQMCDRVAEQLREAIRLDIPDHPPI